MDNNSISLLEFRKSNLFERLIYLKYCNLLNKPVDAKEIIELEQEVYPELKGLLNRGKEILSLRELDELRLLLFSIDQIPNNIGTPTKALVIRLEATILRMRADKNHQRPHFHIEYKQLYNASYAIDKLEQLEGYMPIRYEKGILDWASHHENLLRRIWNDLKTGNDITDLLIEAQQSQ